LLIQTDILCALHFHSEPHEKLLGCNPLSDAPYRNMGMVLNREGPGRHPFGGLPYFDLNTVLNEQGSDRRIASLVARYIAAQV
jgi:hypothetical protein